jgi:hypothetical protein
MKYADNRNIRPRTTRKIILNIGFLPLIKNKIHIISNPAIIIAKFRKVAPYLNIVKTHTNVIVNAMIIENRFFFI